MEGKGEEKMDVYERAYELKDEIIEHRRTLHQIAEVGMDLPETVAYVKAELTKMGYTPVDIGKGVSALVGKPGKTVLLRADMDALSFPEQSGLPFAAKTGTCHACGHDIHTSVLLGAARILKERENELQGTVKLMFQPGEEPLEGAKNMVENGILNNPDVDYALALHVRSTENTGIGYTPGVRYASSNNFSLHVKGIASHGAMPYNGVDPIMIASHIVIGIQELVSREIPFNENAVITIGQFTAGNSCNSIPAEVEIKGTMRSFSNKTREHLKHRLPELAESIAKSYRGTAELEWLSDVPVLINDKYVMDICMDEIRKMAEGRFDVFESPASTGSEDFAVIAEKVPTFMFSLFLPDKDSDVRYALHSPKIRFDESFIPVGTAAFVACAERLLKEA